MSRLVNFRWPDELVKAIDAARGDVSRSMFVRRLVEGGLGEPREFFTPHVPVVGDADVGRKLVENVEAAVEHATANSRSASSRYKCRVSSCDFSAGSPTAKCPRHPGKLDPS